jgi:hypothetical protein
MRNQHFPCLARPSLLCLATALMLFGPVVLAEQARTTNAQTTSSKSASKDPSGISASIQISSTALRQEQEAPPDEVTELGYEPLQVGDATQDLFAWQRRGEIASSTPRPIAGVVAARSYERYLKSFEFSIPERMSSTVKSSSTNGNTK